MLNIKRNIVKNNFFETTVYSLMATVAAISTVYLCYNYPVHFAFLITEDSWAEYGTAVSYGLAGVFLIMLSFRKELRRQKLIWVLMGLVAIFLAGEEISWGQRIMNITTPDVLRNANYQGEINIHNLNIWELTMRRYQARIAACFVLGWMIFSLVVFIMQIEERINMVGLPLMPIRIFPMFILPLYFFILKPTVTKEMGECFLGIAVVIWAFDQFLHNGWVSFHTGLTPISAMFGMLIFVAGMSTILPYLSHNKGNLSYKLNRMAEYFYPNSCMYDQAQLLYEYIYKNPHYVKPCTKSNHGKVLLGYGKILMEREKQNEAFDILQQAVNLFEANGKPYDLSSKDQRFLGKMFVLLKKNEEAVKAFRKAIEIDQHKLESALDPNERAKLLWSLSKTFKSRGNLIEAINNANAAKDVATSKELSLKIVEWINDCRPK